MNMKRKVLIGILVSSLFFFTNSNVIASNNSTKEYVENLKLSISFSFGERTGFYSGSMLDGVPDGVGKFESSNGSGEMYTYIGEWKSGHFEGMGTSVFENGTLISGTYSNDYLNGNCIVVNNNSVYLGDSSNGSLTGSGTLLTLTSERYKGEFKDGLFDGTGTCYYANGNYFEGEFSNHCINGEGTYYYPSGQYMIGDFETNKDTNLIDASGTFYSGSDTFSCKMENGNLIINNNEESNVANNNGNACERLKNAQVFESDVFNGTGTDVIGKRAYVILPKEDLKSITEQDYSDFLNTKVKGQQYNWFSIICDDGTGIVFAGSFAGLGTYGKIDSEGCITEAIGNIISNESGGYTFEKLLE